MKTLLLVRHAKSSWKDAGLPDRHRPLNKRGHRDAPRMGQRLAERGIEIDRLITSPATRAWATAEAIASEIGYPWEQIVEDEMLYEAGASEMLQLIEALDDYIDTVMLVAHNPGLTELVNYLSPYYVENVPTCGVVELTYESDTWAGISEIEPARFNIDYPKQRKRQA